jgi:hypothetical protein
LPVLRQLHRERLAVRAGLVLPRHHDLHALGRICQRQHREREPIPWPQNGWGLLQLVQTVEQRRIVRADGQLGGPDVPSGCRAVVGEHQLQRGRVPATTARTSACCRAWTSSRRRASSIAVSLACMRVCRYAKIAVAIRLAVAMVALTTSPVSISRGL